jgi:hypothetical protein
MKRYGIWVSSRLRLLLRRFVAGKRSVILEPLSFCGMSLIRHFGESCLSIRVLSSRASMTLTFEETT